MKGIFISIFMLLLLSMEVSPASPVVQADLSKTLNINAYKVGALSEVDPEYTVAITDAINVSHDTVSDGGKVDLSPELSSLLGNLPSIVDNNDFLSRVVFSYRVTGNAAGNHTISIVCTAFKLDDYHIDAYYELENRTYQFQGTETDTGSTIKSADAGTIYASSTILDGDYASDGSVDANLKDIWVVNYGDGKTVSSPWIVRGSVGIVISNQDFTGKYDSGVTKSVPNGEYKANVTITFIPGA